MYDLRNPWENRLCCVGAAAAVAATVATVASVGMQVAKSAGAFGEEGGGAGAAGAASAAALAPGTKETLFNRGTQDLLDAERSILDDALAQGKLLEPQMYEALGLRPVYDRPEDPQAAALASALADKKSAFDSTKARIAELQGARRQLKGKAHKAERKALAKEIKQLRRASGPAAQREIAALTNQVEQSGAVGRKVVGFEAIGGVADPTGSAGGAFGGVLNEFNSHLEAALAGKEPLDPTLKRTFDDRERTLRDRLRRQMGPDYETSTGGAQALAAFDRERSEAYAAYNRESIAGFSSLAESRAAALTAATSGRLKNLSYPAAFRASLATQLEGAASARNETARIGQTERGLQAQGAANAAAGKAADDAAARDQRFQALQSILAGVGSAAGTAQSYGAQHGTLFGPNSNKSIAAEALKVDAGRSASAQTTLGG